MSASNKQRRRRGEDGQVMVLAALAMMGLVSVVGLVVDGGAVFSQRRDVQNVADAAALAGAMQIDLDAYRATGSILLDTGAARQAAIEYLQTEEGVDYAIQVSETAVEVSVTRQASTTFLRLVGIDGFDVSATSSSQPRHGIAEAGE